MNKVAGGWGIPSRLIYFGVMQSISAKRRLSLGRRSCFSQPASSWSLVQSSVAWCLAVSLLAAGCRRGAQQTAEPGPRLGEGPEHYSARVLRTVEQGGGTERFESFIWVSGQMIREDWTEKGEKRSLIIRPDLGETYLLFPEDQQTKSIRWLLSEICLRSSPQIALPILHYPKQQ